MSSKQTFRSIFEGKQNILEEKIDTEHGLLTKLVDGKVITREHKAAIEEVVPKQKRAGKLLDILHMRDDELVPAFCRALEETEQQHVVRELYKEQESRETESTKQQEDVSGSHRLLQQQSNQSSETIAPLLQQLSQLQLATMSVSVHVGMNPEIPQVEEHNVVALLTRVKGIINQHKQTSHDINRLMRRLREDMNANERTLIKDQLVNEFEAALFQGRVPPEIVPELARLLVYISVEAIEIVTTQNGDSIVICFLCKTVKALYKLGQMITSGFMHAVFAAVIKSLVHRPTTVDVYVRADEFNFKVLHLSSPHDKVLRCLHSPSFFKSPLYQRDSWPQKTDVKSMPLSMFIQQEKTLVYDRRLDHSSPISSRDVATEALQTSSSEEIWFTPIVDCLSYKLREMILLKSCWLMIRAEMKSERRPHVNAYIRLTSVCCHFCEVVKDEHFCCVVRAAVRGRPTILGVHDVLSSRCTVIYLPPDNDGGAAVTGYLMECRSPGLEWIRLNDTPVTRLEQVVDSLAPLTKYQFRVAAVNKFGIGSFSEASEMITTKAPSVPDQPRWPLVVKLIGTSVTLEWTAPLSDSKISSYVIRYGVPGTNVSKYSEAHVDGQTTSCTLTQLKPKTKYHFAVAAKNEIGRGPLSIFSDCVITHKQSG